MSNAAVLTGLQLRSPGKSLAAELKTTFARRLINPNRASGS